MHFTLLFSHTTANLQAVEVPNYYMSQNASQSQAQSINKSNSGQNDPSAVVCSMEILILIIMLNLEIKKMSSLFKLHKQRNGQEGHLMKL